MDLIYMGSRKRQDFLSKLGAWGQWERVEGEGREQEGSREKYNKKILKRKKKESFNVS